MGSFHLFVGSLHLFASCLSLHTSLLLLPLIGGIEVAHDLDILLVIVTLLWGELLQITYRRQLSEDGVLVQEWYFFQMLHIVQYVNPTIKYIHTLWLLLLEERQLQEHHSHLLEAISQAR